MKNQLTLLVLLLCTLLATAQENTIKTKSVTIDNLITFVVDQIERKTEDSNALPESFTFLLQTPASDLLTEDKVILKQAFKLISKRLLESDRMAIVTYSGFSGIALQKTSAKDLKAIMFAIENLKSNVKEFHKDGVDLAYTYAKEASEDFSNTVVMIRNPKVMISRVSTAETLKASQNNNAKNNNAILLTAISLLPQIISVIKD